jgi:hypothetical protein
MIKTKEIYELLSRGGFISQDSTRADVRRLYDYIEENFDEYKAYYQGIGFLLEQGNGYFHFSREDSRTEITRRLTTLGVWIDRLDFVKTFHNGFSTGVRFTPSTITEAVSADVELKEKARNLYHGQHSAKDTVQMLVDDMEKAGFIELENEFEQIYKVTSAFHFLEGLVEMLTISEEEASDETAQ